MLLNQYNIIIPQTTIRRELILNLKVKVQGHSENALISVHVYLGKTILRSMSLCKCTIVTTSYKNEFDM